MRILVVEDEHKIANTIKRGLEQAGYTVDLSYDGDNGLVMATTKSYDLVIVDGTLPHNREGLEIIKQMRENALHTPILLLTAKDSVRGRITGLDTGADDYLVKPFALEKLLNRVRALAGRSQDQPDTTLTYADIVLDPINFMVTRGGKQIILTHKEFGLLEFLMRNPGKLLSKDVVTRHVWDYNANILPNTVEVYIGYLRNKLEKPFKGKPLIQTRRGFGYVFGEAKNDTL